MLNGALCRVQYLFKRMCFGSKVAKLYQKLYQNKSTWIGSVHYIERHFKWDLIFKYPTTQPNLLWTFENLRTVPLIVQGDQSYMNLYRGRGWRCGSHSGGMGIIWIRTRFSHLFVNLTSGGPIMPILCTFFHEISPHFALPFNLYNQR